MMWFLFVNLVGVMMMDVVLCGGHAGGDADVSCSFCVCEHGVCCGACFVGIMMVVTLMDIYFLWA